MMFVVWLFCLFAAFGITYRNAVIEIETLKNQNVMLREVLTGVGYTVPETITQDYVKTAIGQKGDVCEKVFKKLFLDEIYDIISVSPN
jgi:hypothetical protein